MKIRILQSAIEDLHSGRLFYENMAEGIGSYFFDSLFSDIDSLALYAGIHPIFQGYYRLLAKRFPYAIYYKLENNVATVWRVLDLRRNPRSIKNALQEIKETQ